jgi:hypothetical protein
MGYTQALVPNLKAAGEFSAAFMFFINILFLNILMIARKVSGRIKPYTSLAVSALITKLRTLLSTDNVDNKK